MSEPTLKATTQTLRDGRLRFGLKGLLATVLVSALIFGWVGCENRRAQQQSILIAELIGVGVRPDLHEPTAIGFFVKKRFPSHEAWIRERIGEGWLSRPTVFLCSQLTDEQVPYAIERMKRLGTVREVHYQDRELTERGLEKIRSSLLVEVVPRSNPALQRYLNSQMRGEHFALGGLIIEASLAIVLLGILASILWFLGSLVRHRGPEHTT